MKTDIVTLCRSARISGDRLSITGAFNIIYAPSLPHRLPPSTVALRIVFDDSEFGEHLLRLTVMDTDGKLVCADEDVHFYLDQPPASSPLLPESVRRIATWCIVRRLMEIELKLYGEYAIDLSLDGQPPLRTTFYVYPPQDA